MNKQPNKEVKQPQGLTYVKQYFIAKNLGIDAICIQSVEVAMKLTHYALGRDEITNLSDSQTEEENHSYLQGIEDLSHFIVSMFVEVYDSSIDSIENALFYFLDKGNELQDVFKISTRDLEKLIGESSEY